MTKLELEQCMDAHGKEIYSFCKSLTGNQMEADDLYQDTFLTAMEKDDKIHMEGNPKSYLLSVAVRLWKNRKRKFAWRNRIAGMETFVDGWEEHGTESVRQDSPEEIFFGEEEKQIVRHAVRGLPEKHRVVVLLFYMEEMTVAEIAAVLKLPQGTVKSRLHHARQQLQNELEVVLNEKRNG